ncbi:MAG: peroxiredoxin [Candidatus Dormibacteria bacterium]
MPLVEGDPAPAFTAESGAGGSVSSKELLGKRWVLYFYPKDMTEGCTIETREFGVLLSKFKELGVSVFGCSVGGVKAKTKFAAACDAPDLPLLADPDHGVAEAFGVWGERRYMGRAYMGVSRTTFLVDGGGKVARVWEGVTPRGHAAEVLEVARSRA